MAVRVLFANMVCSYRYPLFLPVSSEGTTNNTGFLYTKKKAQPAVVPRPHASNIVQYGNGIVRRTVPVRIRITYAANIQHAFDNTAILVILEYSVRSSF